MRFVRLFFIFITALFHINSWSQEIKTENKAAEISIDIDNATIQPPLQFSKLFSGFKLIPLETNVECLIGSIDKLLIANDFYILDKYSAGSLFVFNNKGEYIRKIGKKGKGPGEYLIITDFDVDTDHNVIYILDARQKKILAYNSEGDFIEDISLKSYSGEFKNILTVDDMIIIDRVNVYDELKKYLLVLDVEGEFIMNLFSIKDHGYGFKRPVNTKVGLHKSGNSFLYTKFLFNQIFEYEGGTISPYIKINSDNLIDRSTVKSFNDITDANRLAEVIVHSKKFLMMNIVNTTELFYLKYKNQLNTQHLFMNQNTSHYLITENLIDDLTYIQYPNFIGGTRDEFIMGLEGYHLMKFRSKVNSNKIKLPISEYIKIEKLDNECNPILVFYKFNYTID